MDAARSEADTDECDAVILGAGISGLVAAKILTKAGPGRVLVVDEYDRIGGNHVSCDIGPYTFDIGTFIFQDDSPLMRHFPELLPLYHPINWRISRITPQNVIRDYPISMKEEVYGTGAVELLKLFGSIAWNRLRRRNIVNADDYARYWIGSRVYERSGLANYVARFYGAPATTIDRAFAEKRMGWLQQSASVWRVVAKRMGRKEPWHTSQSFVRPRGGFGNLYDAARRTLERDGTAFALGETPLRITRADGLFRIATDRRVVTCRRLISTIPVDRAYRLCGLGESATLPFSKLVSLFFSFAGDRGFRSNILYNFSDRGSWKRLTMFSDFFGAAAGREYFTVEVTTTARDPDVAARAAALFQADVEAQAIFKGSLTFEGSHELDNAYPTYVHGAVAQADHMIGALRNFGVESMGRQGGFDYLPTARHVTLVIEEAMKRGKGRRPCPAYP